MMCVRANSRFSFGSCSHQGVGAMLFVYDTASGEIKHTPNRPKDPIYIDFRAEMDLAVAASACPDLAAPDFGQPIQALIYEP